jgi:hypothetical protein
MPHRLLKKSQADHLAVHDAGFDVMHTPPCGCIQRLLFRTGVFSSIHQGEDAQLLSNCEIRKLGFGRKPMPPVFIDGGQKGVFGGDLSQIVRVDIKEAYPGPLYSLKGFSLRTKEPRSDALKMCEATNKKDLFVFGCKSLQVVGHAGLPPKIRRRFL